MRIPVVVKKKTRGLSAANLRGLGSSDNGAVEAAVVVTEGTPQVEATNEEYIVTNDAPLLTSEEVAVVETFAASTTSTTAPSSDFIQSVLQTFSEQTLKNVTENIVGNASTISENAALFFKNRYLKACKIELSVNAELGLEVDISDVINTSLLTSGEMEGLPTDKNGLVTSAIGTVSITSSDFLPAVGQTIYNKDGSVSVEYEIADSPSVSTGVALLDPTTALIKSLSESLLVAIGASILGYEFSVFASGDEILSSGSSAALNYNSSVFSGAIAVNMLSRSADGKGVVKDIVATFSAIVKDAVACVDELKTSLEPFYQLSGSVAVDRETLSVDDFALEIMFNTSDLQLSTANRGVDVTAKEIAETFCDLIGEEIPHMILSQLNLQALDVESRTVSLMNSVRSVLDNLKPLLSILPQNLLNVPSQIEEANADIASALSDMKEAATDSDLLTQEYVLFTQDPVGYVAEVVRKSISTELTDVLLDEFEAITGTSLLDANAYDVGEVITSDAFLLAVEEKVIAQLKEFSNEVKAKEGEVKESVGILGRAFAGLKGFLGNLKDSPQPILTAVASLKPAIEQSINAITTLKEGTAALEQATRENTQIAQGSAAQNGAGVALSSMGTGAKVAIGAVVGALLFFGARSILKKR